MKPKAIALTQPARGQFGLLHAFVLAVGMVFAAAQMAPAQDRPATFADLAEKVSPSVVNITTTLLSQSFDRMLRNAPPVLRQAFELLH